MKPGHTVPWRHGTPDGRTKVRKPIVALLKTDESTVSEHEKARKKYNVP
jgi:hypothetical protein